MVMSYPEQVSNIIVGMATQRNKDNVARIAHGLCSAATTLLRSSCIDAGIRILGCVAQVLPTEPVPPRLLALLTKVLAVAIDSDDTKTVLNVSKVLINYVPSVQERPPELNGLITRVMNILPFKRDYTNWLAGTEN